MLRHGVTQKWKTLAVCCSAILRTQSLNFFQAVQLLVSYIQKNKFEFLASKTTDLQKAEPWRNPS
jgi:hypothetical protein